MIEVEFVIIVMLIKVYHDHYEILYSLKMVFEMLNVI